MPPGSEARWPFADYRSAHGPRQSQRRFLRPYARELLYYGDL